MVRHRALSGLAARLRDTVIPAVPVPFGPDGEIDDDALETYAQWMAQKSMGAVALWAHTGRGLLLSDEQRAQVLATWRKALNGTPIVCGVGAPASGPLPSEPGARTSRVIDLTVEMAEAARRGGADSVLVHPPTPLRELRDIRSRVLELHRAVTTIGLPVMAFYLYAAAGGISYSQQTVEELLALEGVLGIKLATLDSVLTYQDLASIVRTQRGALLITGEDRFLGYSLMVGADAALVGIAAACPDVCAALVKTWGDGELAAFVRLSAALDDFARATFVEPMEGYVQRMLWALEADGVLEPGARDPFGPTLADAQRQTVKRAVQALRAGR